MNMGYFFPSTDNHRRWRWEMTSATTIVENMFNQGNQQRQYKIGETRAGRGQVSINVNDFVAIDNAEATIGYPLDQIRHSATSRSFTKPSAKDMYDLRKETATVPSKFTNALIKFSSTQPLTSWEKQYLFTARMTIGVVSAQWGERTDFGWSVCYRHGDVRPFFAGGAGSVMKTSNSSDRIIGELYATRAALATLRRTLPTSWMDQLKITVLTANTSTFHVLGKLGKTTTHNPRW
jgi:hypothetical protein